MALTTRYLSGRLDLNQRPPDPQSGALTRLRHAPIFSFQIAEMGTLSGLPRGYSSTSRIRSKSPCLIFLMVSTSISGGGTGGGGPSS